MFKNLSFLSLVFTVSVLSASSYILFKDDFTVQKTQQVQKIVMQQNQPTNEEAPLEGYSDFYINKEGQKWRVPTGDFKFSVSSKQEDGPVFLSGEIDPVDVHLGDIQKMKVVIKNNVALSKVEARIETDNGTRIVPMKLVSSKALSYEDIKNQKYFVDEKGNLVINDNKSSSNAFEQFVNKLLERAQAEGVVEYTYEAEWKVEDTHTATYHTTFYAEDINGKSVTNVIAWSDPICNFDYSTGILGGTCSPSLGVEGADRPMIIPTNVTLTLSGSSQLAFPPGSSITMNGGNINISGGTVSQVYACQSDGDSDGYPSNISKIASSNSSCSDVINGRRVSAMTAPDSVDCYDSNSNAHPGQTNYFYTNRGDGSFDYNCSGSLEGGWAGTTSPTATVYTQVSYKLDFQTCTYSNYFQGSSGCGQANSTIHECGYYDVYAPNGKSFATNILDSLKSIFFSKSIAAPNNAAGYYAGSSCGYGNCFPYPGTSYSLCH